ncbi:MAG: TRAP transporter large permease subunit [Alphaproteobacteria bacterium]|nr:TRAP transporter large permease subunit [Alphaproteobacteria bacterium]MDP6237109.1 TRAP transporter large permease subunit [Alphaproteobacteria bacterium]MDP7172331.1 TRAP transporter large permease subunit [Alphaproteobacteria bacterium]MDP7234556.1 TRAP transporter large permease subunit [Alphaproteobacteria bacterium]MDP7488051.1 TRAP transporter large permease subunit [Alphaproteobacteria bacterium]
MSIELLTCLMVGAIAVLLIMGLPLAFVTGAVAMTVAVSEFGLSGLFLIESRITSLVREFVLVAVPMFILMASVLERSGVARDLYRAMHILAGGLRGGLAIQTMVVAVLMAAMTGIIGGEIILLGLVALPQMLRLNYDRGLAIGTICAGGSLGTMIPPSIVLIIYGLTAGVDIGQLFVATVMPGLLLASIYVGYIIVRCQLNPELGPPAPLEERQLPREEKLRLIIGLSLPLGVAASVLGSIYLGIASVTEAAGMGALGAIISAGVRRELSWTMLREALYQTMNTCGMLLWITFGATALIGIYNRMGGDTFVEGLITGLPLGPLAIIVVMMAILIILGMFMDWIGICLLTMPIFVPVVITLGYNPIWFGILFCMNMQISYLTPPFGPAAFYLKGVAPPGIKLGHIYNAMWPFIALQACGLVLVLFFPEIALWLPAQLRN